MVLPFLENVFESRILTVVLKFSGKLNRLAAFCKFKKSKLGLFSQYLWILFALKIIWIICFTLHPFMERNNTSSILFWSYLAIIIERLWLAFAKAEHWKLLIGFFYTQRSNILLFIPKMIIQVNWCHYRTRKHLMFTNVCLPKAFLKIHELLNWEGKFLPRTNEFPERKN